MNKFLLSSLLLLLISIYPVSADVTISTFGTDIQPNDPFGSWLNNYNSTTSTITATDGLSGISHYPGVTYANLTGTSLLRLTASITTAPSTLFTINLEDNGGNLASANFYWNSLNTTPTAVTSALTFDPGFDTTNVIGWSLCTSGLGDNAITASFYDLSALSVPEPATLILIPIATLIFFIFHSTKLRKTKR